MYRRLRNSQASKNQARISCLERRHSRGTYVNANTLYFRHSIRETQLDFLYNARTKENCKHGIKDLLFQSLIIPVLFSQEREISRESDT